jgi:pimeloyl-ACP methyl ester carboxylesterase
MARHRGVEDPDGVDPPGWWQLALEARAPFEFAAGLAAAPWLLTSPRGDGHPVLVYPGFLATDLSTQPMRRLLGALGHDVGGWGQGRNLGPRDGTMEQALQRLRALHERSGRRVSLVGWSLGGLYARELAKSAPHAVRCVVTLGSPFAGPARANHSWRAYRWLHRDHAAAAVSPQRLRQPPDVPTTSIYSRSDGVVAWQCSVQSERANCENIEVSASHAGLGVNPLVLHAVADRLAQPEGQWQPFQRDGARRYLFPIPEPDGSNRTTDGGG